MGRFTVSDAKALRAAKRVIQLYIEGSDLTEDQEHVLHDCASEHGQILDNVIHMSWFAIALAENIEALGAYGI